MNSFLKISPLKILDRSSNKGLGRGNLGVLISRAGVGKTACLIHIAFDKLFRKEKLVHVSLVDSPEKVSSYYNVIYSDLLKALEVEDENEYSGLIDRNRMILAYQNQSFEIERFRKNIQNLIDNIDFSPDSIIVDGLDFKNTDREIFEGLKEVANELQVEIWLSALSYRTVPDVNNRGIPFPCDRVDDLLSIIIQLQPDSSGISLRLLKDHDSPVSQDICVKLDPNDFLVSE